MPLADIAGFLGRGGPVIWAIALLSVLVVALAIWKVGQFAALGVWSRRAAARAVALWEDGARQQARDILDASAGLRARVLARPAGMLERGVAPDLAREELERLARLELAALLRGTRLLDLVVTVAPLLGLLGTVLGMIEAFQTLEAAGSRADPAALAGGIWQALLTTAAGMSVAIPASVVLTWTEAQAAAVTTDLESLATRLVIGEPRS